VSRIGIVLLVLFAVLMLLWFLILAGAVPWAGGAGWIVFAAVVCLGLALFLGRDWGRP
jgi:hypothetical protein